MENTPVKSAVRPAQPAEAALLESEHPIGTGKPARFPGIADNPDQTKAAAILLQNEGLFSALIEQAPVGVYVVDAQFRLSQINTRALPAFEKVEPRVGRDFSEVMRVLWGEELGDKFSAIFRHTLATGEPYRSTRFSDRRVDLGEDKAYEWETRRVTLPDGQYGVVCYFNDITEAFRAEQALQASEALYRTIGESINYGVWACDAEGRNTYASESFLKLVGLTQEECSNLGWGQVLHPDDIEQTIAAWKECVRTVGTWDREHRVRGVDGQWHYILARGLPVKDATGKIISWAGINLDLTERKLAEKALYESNQRFRSLTELVEMQVWTANPNGELDFASQECVNYLAADLERDILGNAWAQFVHADDLSEALKLWQHSLATGNRYEVEFRLRSKRGEFRWFLVRAGATRDAEGRISKWIGTNTDINALKTAQQETARASKAKDNFLAALSHELRTPLNPALLIASESADDLNLPAAVRQNFETIRKNIELEALLIDDLLDLTRITSGKMVLNLQRLDIHATIHDALATVQSEQNKKSIRLILNLQAREFTVNGDAARLQQVFWNVLRNAVKFTPPDGQITVVTFQEPEGSLVVKIQDTGIGMRTEELARVFTAFVQGDHAENGGSHRFGGLGLGLAISKNLMELHSGTISAESAGPGQGSIFMIRLPLTKQVEHGSNPMLGAAGQGISKSPAGSTPLTVLLVEDHEMTRTALTQLLTRRSYTVHAAQSLAQARDLARCHKFDFLICDIGLPDGSGNDLMKEFHQNYGMNGIALTGYGMEEDIALGKAAGFVTHLTKPIRVQTLESALALIRRTN